ncbi:MAG: hypothetical protein PVJ57_02570 [Phycisphaerae bacterium]|jgi:hypothetical protein
MNFDISSFLALLEAEYDILGRRIEAHDWTADGAGTCAGAVGGWRGYCTM